MKQNINKPTHDHGHTLDLLITREADNLISSISVEHGLSDHFAITCNLSLKKPKALRKTISSRNLRSMDRQAFREGLHAALSGNDLQSDVHS